MISYELAKELKDKGFPQKYGFGTHFYWIEDGDDDFFLENTEYSETQMIIIPTLEELIEACKEEFMTCGRYVHPENHSVPFFAQGKLTHGKTQTHGGNSPSEAVARLLLATKGKTVVE